MEMDIDNLHALFDSGAFPDDVPVMGQGPGQGQQYQQA